MVPLGKELSRSFPIENLTRPRPQTYHNSGSNRAATASNTKKPRL